MLNVYAAEPGSFRSEEIALLEQAAAYISFALDNFTREEERRRAEEVARRFAAIAESTSDAMVRKSLAAKGERIVDFGSVSVRKDGRHLPVCVTGSPVISNDRQIVGASKVRGHHGSQVDGDSVTGGSGAV